MYSGKYVIILKVLHTYLWNAGEFCHRMIALQFGLGIVLVVGLRFPNVD